MIPDRPSAFAEHVAAAASWHRHLPLLTGAEFMVLPALGRHAGAAADPVRHGPLAFAWRDRRVAADAPFRLFPDPHGDPLDDPDGDARGGTVPPDLPGAEVLTLYPWLSSDANMPELILWTLHAPDLARLRAGAPHPHREDVLRWADAAGTADRLWQALPDDRRDEALALVDTALSEADGPDPDPPDPVGDRPGGDVVAAFAAAALHEGQLAALRRAAARVLAGLPGPAAT